MAALGVPTTKMAESIKTVADDRAAASGSGGGLTPATIISRSSAAWFRGPGFRVQARPCVLGHGAYDFCDVDELEIDFSEVNVKRCSAEIYDILRQEVSGEPL